MKSIINLSCFVRKTQFAKLNPRNSICENQCGSVSGALVAVGVVGAVVGAVVVAVVLGGVVAGTVSGAFVAAGVGLAVVAGVVGVDVAGARVACSLTFPDCFTATSRSPLLVRLQVSCFPSDPEVTPTRLQTAPAFG
jgi:hypothetical protein